MSTEPFNQCRRRNLYYIHHTNIHIYNRLLEYKLILCFFSAEDVCSRGFSKWRHKVCLRSLVGSHATKWVNDY